VREADAERRQRQCSRSLKPFRWHRAGGPDRTPGQLEQINHLPGPGLLAVSRDQSLPDLIEASRPKTCPALLFERARSSQRTRLSGEYIKIVFEIEHLLMTAEL
jgi:hypothetical protein